MTWKRLTFLFAGAVVVVVGLVVSRLGPGDSAWWDHLTLMAYLFGGASIGLGLKSRRSRKAE